MFMDNEFEVLDSALKLDNITLNSSAEDEHMPETEQQIRVIKERLRAIKNTLPYDCLPSFTIAHMVSYVVLWLNGLSVQSGIYDPPPPPTTPS